VCVCVCVCVCVGHHLICCPIYALLAVFRLKRTTDVMFGGRQVVVCGYGEVWTHLLLSLYTC